MAITKKPQRETLIDSIINKGGSSSSTSEPSINNDNESVKITIRLPKRMVDIIDSHLSSSIYQKARNNWIKEAIEKKIKEEISY